MQNHAVTAGKLDHPLLVEACMKHAPVGYVPVRQFPSATTGNAMKVVKNQFRVESKEVYLVKGHYQLFKRKDVYFATYYPNGCMVFIPQSVVTKKQVKHRTFFNTTSKKVEEAVQDWDCECTSCGDKPVVKQTRLCGVCQFGELSCQGGNW